MQTLLIQAYTLLTVALSLLNVVNTAPVSPELKLEIQTQAQYAIDFANKIITQSQTQTSNMLTTSQSIASGATIKTMEECQEPLKFEVIVSPVFGKAIGLNDPNNGGKTKGYFMETKPKGLCEKTWLVDYEWDGYSNRQVNGITQYYVEKSYIKDAKTPLYIQIYNPVEGTHTASFTAHTPDGSKVSQTITVEYEGGEYK